MIKHQGFTVPFNSTRTLILRFQLVSCPLDLFSLVSLLSHLRPRDDTLENSNNEWIIFRYIKKNFLESITWTEMDNLHTKLKRSIIFDPFCLFYFSKGLLVVIVIIIIDDRVKHNFQSCLEFWLGLVWIWSWLLTGAVSKVMTKRKVTRTTQVIWYSVRYLFEKELLFISTFLAISGKTPPPFPACDWRFNEFPNPVAHALHVTWVELMALPVKGPEVGEALFDVIFKGSYVTHNTYIRADIMEWINAVGLALSSLPVKSSLLKSKHQHRSPYVYVIKYRF